MKINQITEANYSQMTTSEKIEKAKQLLKNLEKYTYVRRDTKGVVKNREAIEKAIDEIYNDLLKTSGLEPQEIKRQIFNKDLPKTEPDDDENYYYDEPNSSFDDMSENEKDIIKQKIIKARYIFAKLEKYNRDSRNTKAIRKQREMLTKAIDEIYNDLLKTSGLDPEIIVELITK